MNFKRYHYMTSNSRHAAAADLLGAEQPHPGDDVEGQRKHRHRPARYFAKPVGEGGGHNGGQGAADNSGAHLRPITQYHCYTLP